MIKHWQKVKLGDICTYIVDNRGKTPPVVDQGIPLIEVNAIGQKNINYKNVSKYVSEDTFSSWFRKYLENGDVLFSTVGRTAMTALYDGSIKAGIAQNIVGLRFGKQNSHFMYYFLTQERNNHKFKSIEMNAVQPSVKVSQMVKLKFEIPPLAEQNRIVAVLETWDNAIDLLKKKIALKKQVKKGLMQRLLSGEVRLPGFIGEWKSVKLGDVATIVMGQSPSSTNYNENGEGIPLIQGNNDIKERKTIERIWTTEITKEAEKGDIILTVRAPVGRVGIAHEDICIGRGVCAIRAKKIDHVFLYKLLEYYETRWENLAQGSTFSSINSTDIKKFSFAIGKLEEQQAIASILITADSAINLLEQKLNALEQQKKFLLKNLVTGEIRTPEDMVVTTA